MVDALVVHVDDGIDKLQHEAPHVFRLEGAMANSDGFVEIATRAKLQDEIHVGVRLIRVQKVDDVRMRAQASVQDELLRLVIDSEVVE
jgi:hypothetical protein